MEHKEFDGSWKEIWTQKGNQKGTKSDVLEYGGWNHSQTPADEIVHKMVSFMEIKNDDNVLEIGCGAGGMAQFLNCKYIGIDYSEPSTKKCMEFFQLPAICCEANDLPFKDGYFDYTFAYGCFMYFSSTDYAVAVANEMRRVSKKGVFIGELPRESHEPKHLLFDECVFKNMGFDIMGGWCAPYEKVRFSAYWFADGRLR